MTPEERVAALEARTRRLEDHIEILNLLAVTGRPWTPARVWPRPSCGTRTACTTSPQVVIDGDTATAVAHSLVVRRTGEGYEVWRASANHWALRRTAAGWRITERSNRTLDGSPESHQILARAVR
jgi:hypothetical protein